MGSILALSVLYLLSSHFVVTRDDRASPDLFGPPVAAGGGAAPGVGSDDDIPYEPDPRANGAAKFRITNDHPAQGPLDYIELQCEGGKPDVDLSYWKDIARDK